MQSVSQQTKNTVTLKGSVEIVSEFFFYGINSILYQRGVYPTESFRRKEKYGLPLLVTADEKLQSYLENIGSQIKQWLSSLTIQKVVVVIKSVSTGEVMERWQFDIECDKDLAANGKAVAKSEKDIKNEIRDVIRQITATVTFLPMLEGVCSFDILVYTDKDSEVPDTWIDSDPQFVNNSQEVKLRSFSTLLHKVDTLVCYKGDD